MTITSGSSESGRLTGATRSSITRRITLGILILVLPTALITLAISCWQGYQAIAHQAGLNRDATTALATQEVVHALSDARRIVTSLQRTPLIVSSLIDDPHGGRATIEPLLAAQLDQFPAASGLWIMDYAARPVYAGRADQAITDARATRSALNGTTLAVVRDGASLWLATPLVVPASGQAEGAVVMRLDDARLLEAFLTLSAVRLSARRSAMFVWTNRSSRARSSTGKN